MANTTDASERQRPGIPRPEPPTITRPLWVLAAVGLGGLSVLGSVGHLGRAGETASAGPGAAERIELVEGDLLIELADRHQTSTGDGPIMDDHPLDGRGITPVSDHLLDPIPASPTTSDPNAARVLAIHAPTIDAPTIEVWVELAPTPEATSIAIDTSLPDHVAVGRAALAEISYPWKRMLPGWTIDFLPGRSGLYGLTMVPERHIEIYIRPDQSPRMVAHVVAHELGHAVDVTLNDGEDRRRWSELRELGDAPWWPESGATDFSTGAGDFAEAFAAWQIGPAGFRSTLADAPTGPEIELLAALSAG